MTTAAVPVMTTQTMPAGIAAPASSVWRQALRSNRVLIGGGILLGIVLLCLFTLIWTLHGDPPMYTVQHDQNVLGPPQFRSLAGWFGYAALGRSVLARGLFGGTISLAVGLSAATISVVLGVIVGLVAGYRGGWVDSLLMRIVDILYGLPYILLVILFKVAFEQPLTAWLHLSPQAANLVVLFSAIGLVSWLTMARVVRGQVLSLRSQPFIEACRALGLKERRVFVRHILPNLIGPITVYATLTVPSAILQESFLSFLGVGVNPPLATWGSLASEGVERLTTLKFYWWMLIFPCTFLAITLLSLNFLADGL